MENTPYFPPLYGDVRCDKCEICTECICAGKHQRNRRDFTYTSGRCPRLPDRRGFVEQSERELYTTVFPLIYAERGGGDSLSLMISIPGEKRKKKVYYTKICGGYWYFREKSPEYGGTVNRVIAIEWKNTKQEILDYMEWLNTDYCIFRGEIEDIII